MVYYYYDKPSCKKIRILYQSFRQNTRVCNIVYNLLEKNPLVLLVLKLMNIQQREIYYIVVQLRPGSGLELTISGSNATGSERPPFYPLGLLGIYIYIYIYNFNRFTEWLLILKLLIYWNYLLGDTKRYSMNVSCDLKKTCKASVIVVERVTHFFFKG